MRKTTIAPSVGDTVLVVHGTRRKDVLINGQVPTVQSILTATGWRVGKKAVFRVGGAQVSATHMLVPGDRLDVVR